MCEKKGDDAGRKRLRLPLLSQPKSEEEYERRVAEVALLCRSGHSGASTYWTIADMFDNWEWEDSYFEHLINDEKQTKLDGFVKVTKSRKDEGDCGGPSDPLAAPLTEPSHSRSSAASLSTSTSAATPLKLTEAQLHLIEFNRAAAKERSRARLAAELKAADEKMFLDLEET